MSTTDDRPNTDFERMVWSHGVPLSAFSSGTVTRLSTSSVESPGAFGLNLHQRRCELREYVERRHSGNLCAGDQQYDGQRHYQDAEVKGGCDDRLEHRIIDQGLPAMVLSFGQRVTSLPRTPFQTTRQRRM